MKSFSAGVLLYRTKGEQIEVLIAHPGGPFFSKKDNGIWSIPKGLYDDNEEPLVAAKREFEEEIGSPSPDGDYLPLDSIKRSDGKTIYAWAVEGDVDTSTVKSNLFEMEWPPKSGRTQEFPEIDRALWADLNTASQKLQPAQVEFLDRLAAKLDVEPPPPPPEQAKLF